MRKLWTDEGRRLTGVPWGERYPRPQLRRKEWLCLNGDWAFSAGARSGRIRVPFCPESLLSGVEDPPEPGEKLVYGRSFSLPDGWRGRRVLLHFGAVMRRAEVFVNGRSVCRHENGYLPFSADITQALREGENELRVEAVNDLDRRWPWGKQSKKRGGMWYTPCSGIWQSVWLEPVPERYIRALRIETGGDWAEITAEGVEEGEARLGELRMPLRGGRARFELRDARRWSPEDPWLYEFTLTSGEDRVDSYFALRTLTTETVGGVPRLCLNGKPCFFNGLLDQGYWSDGLYTPASPEAFEKDILAMKSLGFNTLRKHIKLESELFYYDCDRLGMVVFQDMVNNGGYRYIRDTVLPTLHFQTRRDRRLNPDPETRRIFLESMEATARLLGNHPCVCLWTIFNEGWGQFEADAAYRRLKALDPSRWIDATSGWFHQKESDVDSLHIYFDKLHLGREQRPQLLSEIGGYVWKLPEHSFNLEKTYGYRVYEDRESFAAALRELYGAVLPELVRQGLCGAIYTQLSDVEDETNGLFTFDRAVLKLRAGELRDLAEKLAEIAARS
ncbi:MAG: glycoside hydrolase family 2 [Oscillospiraceae bacterium]|nr:glycoside hydrolase family 2 [Oscillospiraceae bacterium]